ncbi:MAG: type IV pilus biogenesis/stability protein PilW [Legionella sp.]|nr:type IV pilus biogenesis/stability protein PilW [Legionella sp.]
MKSQGDEPETHRKANLQRAAAINVQLGLEYLRQGNYPRAKAKLLAAQQQDDKSPDTSSALAYYFEQTKELKKAQTFYLKALHLGGSGGAQLNNYGAFLCRQGQFDRAQQYFRKAIADVNYINTASAWENAGLCALSASQPAQAKIYFTHALQQDAQRSVSLYHLMSDALAHNDFTTAGSLMYKHTKLIAQHETLKLLAERIKSQENSSKKNLLSATGVNPD